MRPRLGPLFSGNPANLGSPGWGRGEGSQGSPGLAEISPTWAAQTNAGYSRDPGPRSKETHARGDGDPHAGSGSACLLVHLTGMGRDCRASARGPRHREGPLAAVQRGYEEDAVLVLKLIVQLTLVQERNEKTVKGTFPVSPQVLGEEGEAWLLRERKIEFTREKKKGYPKH
ncbi:hypothetical protein Cadr_000016299 [Camelus dromedarius]|uniref:Uncharacterized protein n=1 Tax=Camelus dromedarius TaxID=9838 RepID=A0A5N4EAV9_CAMDR|nr:hypothetical protein Cadr_000016299 [Camelus dromedarius]